MYPTIETIEQLHRKYAANEEVFELVYTHCKIVTAIASQLIERSGLDINVDLVIAGCMLHDIGVYTLDIQNGLPDNKTYIRHGILGYDILKSEGFTEALCHIASHHTGVGLSIHDIESQHLDLPHENFFAESIEERLVMYADKFHSKKPRFNSFDGYMQTVAKFGEVKQDAFQKLADEFGVPELTILATAYQQPIV